VLLASCTHMMWLTWVDLPRLSSLIDNRFCKFLRPIWRTEASLANTLWFLPNRKLFLILSSQFWPKTHVCHEIALTLTFTGCYEGTLTLSHCSVTNGIVWRHFRTDCDVIACIVTSQHALWRLLIT